MRARARVCVWMCTPCCSTFQRLSGIDDGHIPFHGAPPFHTLVGPGQFARVSRERSGGEESQSQPGGEFVLVLVLVLLSLLLLLLLLLLLRAGYTLGIRENHPQTLLFMPGKGGVEKNRAHYQLGSLLLATLSWSDFGSDFCYLPCFLSYRHVDARDGFSPSHERELAPQAGDEGLQRVQAFLCAGVFAIYISEQRCVTRVDVYVSQVSGVVAAADVPT